ncbi:MAG: hypothetical protein NZ893_02580 [Candidatus Aenigmarchaeota archaeon]|nr:hypothetical protein [Candidatus Aenigmarchaeota archaeon]
MDKEPLVLAARIGHNGELTDCKTPWILSAWKEARQKHSTSSQVQNKESVNSKKVEKLNIFSKIAISAAILIFSFILSVSLFQLTDSQVLRGIISGIIGGITAGILIRLWKKRRS